MRLFRPFVPSLAMLLMASSGAGAQGVLIDKSEIRFVSRQMGVNVEGCKQSLADDDAPIDYRVINIHRRT